MFCSRDNGVILGVLVTWTWSRSLADPELQFRGPHGERGARAYNGGLGRAEPPAGSRGRAPGQGAKPPEAESILALGRPTDTANLHPWPVVVFSV